MCNYYAIASAIYGAGAVTHGGGAVFLQVIRRGSSKLALCCLIGYSSGYGGLQCFP